MKLFKLNHITVIIFLLLTQLAQATPSTIEVNQTSFSPDPTCWAIEGEQSICYLSTTQTVSRPQKKKLQLNQPLPEEQPESFKWVDHEGNEKFKLVFLDEKSPIRFYLSNEIQPWIELVVQEDQEKTEKDLRFKSEKRYYSVRTEGTEVGKIKKVKETATGQTFFVYSTGRHVIAKLGERTSNQQFPGRNWQIWIYKDEDRSFASTLFLGLLGVQSIFLDRTDQDEKTLTSPSHTDYTYTALKVIGGLAAAGAGIYGLSHLFSEPSETSLDDPNSHVLNPLDQNEPEHQLNPDNNLEVLDLPGYYTQGIPSHLRNYNQVIPVITDGRLDLVNKQIILEVTSRIPGFEKAQFDSDKILFLDDAPRKNGKMGALLTIKCDADIRPTTRRPNLTKSAYPKDFKLKLTPEIIRGLRQTTHFRILLNPSVYDSEYSSWVDFSSI